MWLWSGRGKRVGMRTADSPRLESDGFTWSFNGFRRRVRDEGEHDVVMVRVNELTRHLHHRAAFITLKLWKSASILRHTKRMGNFRNLFRFTNLNLVLPFSIVLSSRQQFTTISPFFPPKPAVQYNDFLNSVHRPAHTTRREKQPVIKRPIGTTVEIYTTSAARIDVTPLLIHLTRTPWQP